MSAMWYNHGAAAAKTPEYITWVSMNDRCRNPNHAAFHRYGGRGITVCERWLHDFEAFLADMGPRPPNYQINRIDNDGNYTPENCEWTDTKTQAANKTHSPPLKPRAVQCGRCGNCNRCYTREVSRRSRERKKRGESTPQRPHRCDCDQCRLCKDRMYKQRKRDHAKLWHLASLPA